MTIISSAKVEPACDIRQILRDMELTPSETKKLAAIRARLATAHEIAGAYRSKESAQRLSQPSPLENALHAAVAAFVNDPAQEAAEAVARAVITLAAAPTIEYNLASAAAQIEAAATGELNELIGGLFDRAEEIMGKQLDAAQQAMDAAPSLHAEAAIFRQRVVAAVENSKALRAESQNHPLRWLEWEIGK
jgi:hypothetical protein